MTKTKDSDHMLLADGVADTVANYLEAVGTISAVVLALFLQVILVRLRRPSLSMQNFDKLEEEDRVLLYVNPETEPRVEKSGAEFWVRLRVYAEPKKQGATNVQVHLLRAKRPGNASNRAYVPSGPLRPSNVWRHVDTTLPHLAPGTWRRFDVLQLRWHLEGQGEQKLVLPILGFSNPAHEQVLINDPGDYELDFVLSADGIDASFWRFSFNLRPGVAETAEGLPEKINNARLNQLESGERGSKILREKDKNNE